MNNLIIFHSTKSWLRLVLVAESNKSLRNWNWTWDKESWFDLLSLIHERNNTWHLLLFCYRLQLTMLAEDCGREWRSWNGNCEAQKGSPINNTRKIYSYRNWLCSPVHSLLVYVSFCGMWYPSSFYHFSIIWWNSRFHLRSALPTEWVSAELLSVLYTQR